ncbi:unnamed protein product [Orchesella dallaii]|uniref:Uncharacterized protein n=1 Tax=Orchesella dallaii TaxID=48710 RepID=A0ABP1RI62_9HEXA
MERYYPVESHPNSLHYSGILIPASLSHRTTLTTPNHVPVPQGFHPTHQFHSPSHSQNNGHQYPFGFQALPNIRHQTERQIINIGASDVSYYPHEIIGQGSTSIIYKGFFRSIPIAVKRVQPGLVNVYANELKIWEEAARTTQLENVHIVKLFTWIPRLEVDAKMTLYFAMELAKCDLGNRIKTIKQLEQEGNSSYQLEKEKIPGFIHDAAKGLGWLHSSGILHRDIKPENILIFDKAQNPSSSRSDWMAPEALISLRDQEEFYSTKAIDIFSLGMTSHFALTLGIHPFGHSGAFTNMNIIDKNIRPSKIEAPDYAASFLFQWMMEKEPKNRPRIQQVLNHPYFWDWKKSFQFLLDVACCLYDKKADSNIKSLRKKIDQTYLERMLLLQQNPNWKSKISTRRLELLMKRKSNYGRKDYDEESVMMLVELIRDKVMHSGDVVDELLSEEDFGERGSLSKEKYAKFFLTTFPDLVIVLFRILAKEEEQCVDILREEYFLEFKKVH